MSELIEIKKRILFVDDQSMLRMLADKSLTAAGFDVITAENGFVALRLFDERDIDMVLLDVIMPDIDGYHVCEKIRAHRKGREIPVLMMTGLEDMESIKTAFDIGATDFVTKPINWMLLTYRMQFILRAGTAFSDLNVAMKEQQSAEEKINYLAHYDPVTDLPNQTYFREFYKKEHDVALLTKRPMAILFIDFNNLKKINDSLGHSLGDMFLNKVALLLRQSMLTRDDGTDRGLIARFGSNEFTYLLSEFDSLEEVKTLAQELLEKFEAPILLDDHEVYPSASIGIALYPDHGEVLSVLLKNADVAMHSSRSSNMNAYMFYDESMNATSADTLSLESDLRKAIENEEFEAYYQPKLSLKSGTILGFELLIRWNHPKFGLVSPVDFIPLAEEVGLIIPMGYWLIDQACKQLLLLNQRYPDVNIAINLSAVQLQDEGIIAKIKQILGAYDIRSSNVEFELTESVLMDNKVDTISKLNELADLGVSISVDDFGTGYSSLSYLKQLPVNTLKIDRSFIKDLYQDDDDKAITKAIIAMSHNLNLKVVAEGVEDQFQRDFLTEHGCDLIQGYLISKPVPKSEVEPLLQRYN